MNIWTATICCAFLLLWYGIDLPLKVIMDPMDWVLSIFVAIIFYYVVPRLLGIVISFLLFRAIMSEFRVSVGSLGLFQFNNVHVQQRYKSNIGISVEINVSKFALLLWCMMITTITPRRKYLAVIVSGARVLLKTEELGGQKADEFIERVSDTESPDVKPRVFSSQPGMMAYLLPLLAKLIVYALASWVEVIILDSRVDLELQKTTLSLVMKEFTLSMTKDAHPKAGHELNMDLQGLVLEIMGNSSQQFLRGQKSIGRNIRTNTDLSPVAPEVPVLEFPYGERSTRSNILVRSLGLKLNISLSLLPAKLCAHALFLKCGLISAAFDCQSIIETAAHFQHFLAMRNGVESASDFGRRLSTNIPGTDRNRQISMLRPEQGAIESASHARLDTSDRKRRITAVNTTLRRSEYFASTDWNNDSLSTNSSIDPATRRIRTSTLQKSLPSNGKRVLVGSDEFLSSSATRDPVHSLDKLSMFVPEESEIIFHGIRLSLLTSSNTDRAVDFYVAPIELNIVRPPLPDVKQIVASLNLCQEVSLKEEPDCELYELSGIEVKAEIGWNLNNSKIRPTFGGADAAITWARVHFGVQSLRLKLNTTRVSFISDLSELASKMNRLQPIRNTYLSEQKRARSQAASLSAESKKLELSRIFMSALLNKAEASITCKESDTSDGLDIVVGTSNVSIDANGSVPQTTAAASMRSFRPTLSRKQNMSFDIGFRMNSWHIESHLTADGAYDSFKLLDIDSCSVYVKLENMKLSQEEALTGEIVGLKLWFEAKSLQHLILVAISARNEGNLINRRSESQMNSSNPFPIKFHFQNCTLHFESTLQDSRSGREKDLRFLFLVDISKGKLERMHRQSSLDFDLETSLPEQVPVLSVLYKEFTGPYALQSKVYNLECKNVTPECCRSGHIEHTLLRIYSVKFKQMPKRPIAIEHIVSIGDESEDDSGIGEDVDIGDNAVQSHKQSRYKPYDPAASSGQMKLQQKGKDQMVDGMVEVNVTGLRIDWHPFVQFSMLHYIFPFITLLNKYKQETDKQESASDAISTGESHQRDATTPMRLCLEDSCLVFSCGERSVIGLEVRTLNILKIESEPQRVDSLIKNAESGLKGNLRGVSIHRVHDDGNAAGNSFHRVVSKFAYLPLGHAESADDSLKSRYSLLSESLRTDKFLVLGEFNISLAFLSDSPNRISATIQFVNLNIIIPWSANLSTHGRREGFQGRWNGTRLRGREGVAYWTDLGIMGSEAILTVKMFQLYIMPWIRGPNVAATVTDFPAFLAHVQLEITEFRVQLEDDPWEKWVGTIFRLRVDEINQQSEQRKRLVALLGSNSNDFVPETLEQTIEHELQRLDATLWKQRVRAFKMSPAFRNAPPLFDVCFRSISCGFTPRPASYLIDHLIALDGSGLPANKAAWPQLDTLLGGDLREGLITAISVRVRDHCEPVFQVSRLHFCPDGPDGPAPGVVAAMEEICPESHMTTLKMCLHPALAPALIPRSFGSTKIWGRLDVVANEPRITVGPSVLPAVSIISNTISGVAPPGDDPSPSLSSWDKLRLLVHGLFSVKMDKACIRLLSDRDPHTASECLQLRGEGLMVTNKNDPRAAPPPLAPGGGQLWRLRIGCERMQCEIESEREEMTSAMLLQRPLFKAVRLETTITMHWKCRGPAAAHHYVQMLAAEQRDSASASLYNSRTFEASHSHILSNPKRRSSGSPRCGDGFEDADEIPAREVPRPETNCEIDSGFDTYRRFRSSALAMTVRMSATQTHTVLHVKTMRWISDFMDAVEQEADPVRRYVGSVDKARKRRKTLVPRSSLSLHTKAVQVPENIYN